MEIRQIRYFLAIAKYGSFTLAAEQIGIAQPALSAQIAKLEAQLKCTLFVRHPRGVDLTPTGERFRGHAIEIWERIEAAEQDTRQAEYEGDCELTIGIPTLTSTLLIAPLIEAVRLNVPTITLRVREAMGMALRDMLAAGQLDLALLYSAPGDDFADRERLFEEDLYLGSLASCSTRWELEITAGQISSIPLVLSTPGNSHRLLLEDFARRTGAQLNVVAEVDSIVGQRDLVLKGVGATILPLSGFANWPQEDLRLIPVAGEGLVSQAILVRSSEPRHSRSLQAFRGLLRRTIGDLIESGRWRGARIYANERSDRPSIVRC
jgi:DNA-binding transcriptional LysR family regulator